MVLGIVGRRPRRRWRASAGWHRCCASGLRSPRSSALELEQELASRAASAPRARLSTAHDAESLHQAVPDDRRADAAAARPSRRRWPSRCSTTARRPSTSCTRACSAAARRLPDRERRARVRPSGSGAMESAVANLVRPGDAGARLRRRQVRRALDRARRGLRRRGRALRAGLGRAPRPRRGRPAARRERRHRGRLRHAVRDLDRHRARRPGARRGRPRHGAILVVDAVSGLGAAELRQDEWGDRRRRRRLAEGADVPARPGLRVASPSARSIRRRSSAGGRYYFDWGRTVKAQRKDAELAFTPAVTLFLGARRRARHDRGGGAGERHRPPRPARPRHPRRRAGHRARALRRPRRALDRRDRRRAAGDDRRRQGAQASCASSASPPTAARTSSRAGSCASPTAATSAPSTSSRRWPGWRWRSTSSATRSSRAPASARPSGCSLEAGVPAAA